jgi:hypothetical protein
MGEILDITAAMVFLCLVVPKTVIISKFFSINVASRVLWAASVGSFVLSLATLLLIAIVSLPIIVGIAYQLSSSKWLQAAPFLAGYAVVTIVPGLLYERHKLSKGGVDRSVALAIAVISNFYLLAAALALALFFYIIAMKHF